MEIAQIIEEAEALIKEGKLAFSKETKRYQYYTKSEYYFVYSKAVDLLVEYFRPENEAEICDFFRSNIPHFLDYRNIKELADLSTQFENLGSPDSALRIKASKYFRGKALQQTSGFRAMLFKRPDVFERLFIALRDPDPKVVRNIIIALGGAHNRYFKHHKVYENLSPFYHSKNSDHRYYALIWTRFIEDEGKLDEFKSMLEKKQPKRIKELLEKFIAEHES